MHVLKGFLNKLNFLTISVWHLFFWLSVIRHTLTLDLIHAISNRYTMGCPPGRVDNSRALASGLSYVHVDKHGETILYHLH